MTAHDLELVVENGDILRGSYQEPFYVGQNLKSAPIMIFCHSFPNGDMKSHDDLFGKLQNICASLGLHSIRFDYRGCGSSDGAIENLTLKTALQDTASIIEWCKEQGYERRMLTAEGLGAVTGLISFQESAEAGAFFWPVLHTEDFATRNLQAEEHKGHFDKNGYTDTALGKTSLTLIKELYEMDLAEVMSHVKYPCLFQHGSKDQIVPIEFLDIACAHLRNRRIEITSYQDGEHGLLQENHRKNMMYHYEQFIQKYI